MIWIWLLLRHAYSWYVPVERYRSFFCLHCHATFPAYMRTVGFGKGRSQHEAMLAATRQADANVERALLCAACPSCGKVSPSVLAAYEKADAKLRWRHRWRIPATVFSALVGLLGVGTFAIADRHESLSLALVAACAAAALGALVFSLFSTPARLPFPNCYGLWFSHVAEGTIRQAPGESWFPAKLGETPAVRQPSGLARALGLGTTFFAVGGALVALFMWSTTFQSLYVVNSETHGDLIVRLDGQEIGRVAADAPGDAAFGTFSVRNTRPHDVSIAAPNGEILRYTLASGHEPGETLWAPWVIAPHGFERGLCLTDTTMYYGITPPATNHDDVINEERDFIPLAHDYDHFFEPPPSTIQSNGGTTRRSLRALSCRDWEDGEILTPFRNDDDRDRAR